MPHFPKPFFRPKRGLWYVQVQGKQLNLGPDKEKAFKKYHELMQQPVLETDAVVVLIDAFLDWCKLHRESRTYDWYFERCQSFVDTIPATMTVTQLKPFHVQQWVDDKDWNDGMKRGAMIAVQRAFNWLTKQGHIRRSPISWLEKPQQGRRERVVSEKEYLSIVARFDGDSFADLLTLAWETGARAQELLRLEARHVQDRRWVFPAKEARASVFRTEDE